jgi:hypothetical protein
MHALQERIAARNHRVEKISIEGTPAWLKHAEPPPSRWRYTVLDFIANRFGLRLAVAIPKPGHEDSLMIERERIARLADIGIRVPAVLHAGNNWHVLSDIGMPIRDAFRSATPVLRYALLNLLLDEIARIHQHGEYLSQAVLRNIVCDSAHLIGFIDFEEDPAQRLPVELCQARDILLMLCGLTDYFTPHDAEFLQAIGDFLADGDPDVRSILLTDAQRLGSLLTVLGPVIKSREVHRLHRASQVLARTD